MDEPKIPKIDLMPGQLEFLHVPNAHEVTMDYAIYQGGVGSGKTFVGCVLGMILVQLNPGLVLLCLAKTFPLLRDTTMATYFELLDFMGYQKDVDYKWNEAKALLTFLCHGNAKIMFRHLENPEKIKSINAGAVQIEEISQISQADFRMAQSRLRQKGIKRYRLFGHTNPEAAKGWIFKTFVDENPGVVRTEWENAEGQMEPAVLQFRRIIASTMDNKHLPPHYVESLRQTYDEDYFAIYVLGQDGDYRKGLVVSKFNEANKDEELVYNPAWPIYLTCDFNVDPMCWAMAHRVDGDFLFFDELTMECASIEDAAMEFCNRYGDHKQAIFVGGDASGNSKRVEGSRKMGMTSYSQLMTVLRREGLIKATLDVASSNPLIRDRVDIFNGAVANAEGRRRVKVNPKKCPRIMYNIDNLKYIEGSSVIATPTVTDIIKDRDKKFLGHMFDAISYLVCKYTPKVVDKGGMYGNNPKIKTVRL